MNITNIIKIVSDGKEIPRDWDEYEGITVHRVGEDEETGIVLGESAEEICDHFNGRNPTFPEVAKATGGHLPYTGMIEKNGVVKQCLRLSDVGYHAMQKWSGPTIGVAVIGDPRHNELPRVQWLALVEFCALLSVIRGTSAAQIQGHDERPGARGSGSSKVCPGQHVPMGLLRQKVRDAIRAGAEGRSTSAGLIY